MQTGVNEVSERLTDEMPVSEPGHSLIALLQVEAVAGGANIRNGKEVVRQEYHFTFDNSLPPKP